MSTIELEEPAFALLQWWVIQRDKNENLLSTKFEQQSAPIITSTHEISLGRKGNGENKDNEVAIGSFIHLCDQKTISRQHASICWNEDKGQWYLKCCSKNGMTFNSKVLRPEHGFVELVDKSTMRIGPVYAYFTLPLDNDSDGVGGGESDDPRTDMVDGEEKSVALLEEVTDGDEAGGGDNQNNEQHDASDAGDNKSGNKATRTNYSKMLKEVFASVDKGLTKKDIIDQCLSNHPEIDSSKRRNLVSSISNQLKKKGVEDANGLWTISSASLAAKSPCVSPRPNNEESSSGMKRKASDEDDEINEDPMMEDADATTEPNMED